MWLLSLVEDEQTELPLDRLPLGDLGHLISLMRGLEYVPNLFGTLTLAPYYTPLDLERRGV